MDKALLEHQKTPGYQKAKEALLDKLAYWGRIKRGLFDPADIPKRRLELKSQAAQYKARGPHDFETPTENMDSEPDPPTDFRRKP